VKKKTWIAAAAVLAGMVTATAIRADVAAYAAYWDTDSIGDGIGFGLTLSLDMTSELRAEGRIGFMNNFDAHHQDISVVPLEVALTHRIYHGERYDFRLGAGIGYYIVDGGFAWPGARVEPDAESDAGYFILASTERVLTQDLSLFVEGKYMFLSFDKAKAVGDHLQALKFDGLGANVGLRYRW